MPADPDVIFATLKAALAKHAPGLTATADTPTEYTLSSNSPSPFHQHKGHPLQFASVRTGKAYVSVHLMPLYMNDTLTQTISPDLKKRMQGKTCFNFKNEPTPEQLAELNRLTSIGFKQWADKKWL